MQSALDALRATSTGDTSRLRNYPRHGCQVLFDQLRHIEFLSAAKTGSFAFLQLLNIIQLLCVDSLTTCLTLVDWRRCQSFTAKECILGYSFEQDFRLAQAAPAFRYFAARNLSFRTLLHQLKGADRPGRLQ